MDLDTQWIDALWIYHKHKCIKYFFITLLYIQLQLPVSFTPLHTHTYKHTLAENNSLQKKIKNQNNPLHVNHNQQARKKKKKILKSNKTHNSYPKYTCNHSITHWYWFVKTTYYKNCSLLIKKRLLNHKRQCNTLYRLAMYIQTVLQLQKKRELITPV